MILWTSVCVWSCELQFRVQGWVKNPSVNMRSRSGNPNFGGAAAVFKLVLHWGGCVRRGSYNLRPWNVRVLGCEVRSEILPRVGTRKGVRSQRAAVPYGAKGQLKKCRSLLAVCCTEAAPNATAAAAAVCCSVLAVSSPCPRRLVIAMSLPSSNQCVLAV
jgi:hypothetical protein